MGPEILDCPDEILALIMESLNEDILALIRAHSRFWHIFRAGPHHFFKSWTQYYEDSQKPGHSALVIRNNIYKNVIVYDIYDENEEPDNVKLKILNGLKNYNVSIGIEYNTISGKIIGIYGPGRKYIYFNKIDKDYVNFIYEDGPNIFIIDTKFVFKFNIDYIEKIYKIVVCGPNIQAKYQYLFQEVFMAANAVIKSILYKV